MRKRFERFLKKTFPEKNNYLKDSELPNPNEKYEIDHIYEDIKKTQNEWEVAKSQFNNTTDPDQIDYLIYLLELYEKKLKILYKRAKEIDLEE